MPPSQAVEMGDADVNHAKKAVELRSQSIDYQPSLLGIVNGFWGFGSFGNGTGGNTVNYGMRKR